MPWLAQVRERNQGTDWAAGRWEDSTESLENDLHNYSLIWRLESFPVRSDVFWLRINVESFSGSPREDSVMITFIWYYCFYFTYFKIHGSEETHRKHAVLGAEVWGEGREDASAQDGLTKRCRVPGPPSHLQLPPEWTQLQARVDEKEGALCQHLAGTEGRVEYASVHEFLHLFIHSFILLFLIIYWVPYMAGTVLGIRGVTKQMKLIPNSAVGLISTSARCVMRWNQKSSQRHLQNGWTVCVPQALGSGSFPQMCEKQSPPWFMAQAFFF